MFQSRANGPQVHAIVIGVGDYPHLKDGTGALFNGHENMGQLSSAPVSARTFAKWLLCPQGYCDPGRPLGTLRLLLSEPGTGPATFKPPGTNTGISVARADLVSVRAELEDWQKDMMAEGDLAIFFFSGHGVVAGFEQALLLSDFGNPQAANVGAAIRFSAMRNGMRHVPPREQCYFIDACRAYSRTFADSWGGLGESIISPDPTRRFSRSPSQPVLNATLEGESAFGKQDEPSLFTSALMQALRGGGSDDRDTANTWLLDVNLINQSVEFIVRRTAERVGLGLAQIPAAEGLTSLSLGALQGDPFVPVALSCDPDHATGEAEFAFCGANIWRCGQPDPLVQYGTHEFSASFSQAGSGYGTASLSREIRPPFRSVRIQVQAGNP